LDEGSRTIKHRCDLSQKLELKEATVKQKICKDHRIYDRGFYCSDLESGRNSLQKDLHTAEVNNNDQLEAIAALTQTVSQKLLELEGARLDLDQKTATIEEQKIMLEDIRREKEAEENNKIPLELGLGTGNRCQYGRPYRFQYNRYYPDRNATHISVLLSGACAD